jgi:hypothetical protein
MIASLIVVQNLSAQGFFETKIIIEQSLFYAVQIENQAAKLYVGKLNQPIDSAKIFALPAGTKRRSANFLPFSWDISHDTIYAINFTEHPQNNRLTSLKSIPLKSLHSYDPERVQQQLLEAARLNSMVMNLPLKNTISKYSYMDDLFFDVLMKDGVLYQFISVKDELTAWKYANGKWEQSEIFPFDAEHYFLAYMQTGKIYLVNSKGETFHYDNTPVHASSLGIPLAEHILINNRDTGRISFVNRNAFDNTSLSIQSILDKYGKN